MRTRAFRPEAPVRMEDRSLLSGLAVPSAHPVVLPLRKFNLIVDHMRQGFILSVRNRDPSQIRSEIDDIIVKVPFERVDGLDVTIYGIIAAMRHELAAHAYTDVGKVVSTAQKAVVDATGAEVRARVLAGDVVLT